MLQTCRKDKPAYDQVVSRGPLPLAPIAEGEIGETDLGAAVRLPKEQRRAQVIAAARATFLASGYHAASMEEIADRAGVSKPVLYQHFPGKLDLYLAILEEGIEALLAATQQAVRSTPDNKVRVQETIRTYFTFFDDPQGAIRLVLGTDLMSEPKVRKRIDATKLALARIIAAVIAEDTGLDTEQSLLLGSGLLGLAEGGALRWLAHKGERMPLDEAADLTAHLAWRGIASFPLSHPPQA